MIGCELSVRILLSGAILGPLPLLISPWDGEYPLTFIFRRVYRRQQVLAGIRSAMGKRSRASLQLDDVNL